MGCIAFWQSWRTFPSESFPSRVVRSSIEMASRMPCSFAFFLIDRLPSDAARSSIPTASTRGIRAASKASGELLMEPSIIWLGRGLPAPRRRRLNRAGRPTTP